MSKFKICPDCGRRNPPGRIECEECEADLTAVPLTDGGLQEDHAQSAAVQSEPPAKPRPVRICACGAENPAAARVCASCGEDISDIIPTTPGEIRCTLAACDGSWALAMTSPELILGRERELAERFAAKPFVSRVHAKLSMSGGRVFIEDMGATNHTYVNGELVTEEPRELLDGDVVGLGGSSPDDETQRGAAYFNVRICR